ncbi:hypothetical protein [Mucilaginibacter sp. 5C4]|uniref:hypothetical protein n=1 Tax=Mucilaginibacter sp. 5C4 TaxID=3048589 RepID=UPI002AC93994|nr:hypothetical protein [Mucilaginibacter sp. 5C4]MEB0301561.1 hypothetical protein [Mucilaginibacter sp. 5C4]WPX25314.1 hypothetical protein RHM67_08570 [Mucilaginibacter sp. 5C4]
MSENPQLPADLSKDVKRIGNASLLSWISENKIELPKSDNFLDSLAKGLVEGAIRSDQLNAAISELDENSDKKIILMTIDQVDKLLTNKKSILQDLHKRKGIVASDKKWVNGDVKNGNPTFIYMYWDEDILKIKYSEIQYNVETDYETEKIVKTEKRVNIIFIIDPKDGFVQIRFDSPGNIHRHKNDTGKISEAAYEGFYKELLLDLFQDLTFKELNLNKVANHLATVEVKKFRITKGVTTITNNAKQTFATASIQADVRNLPEYVAAASKGTDYWLAEDLTGYWVASESEDSLRKDLFMRISRKYSQIRVQRGCLEKELNYGISKIREIQGTV